MKKVTTATILISALFTLFGLSGCTQMPTEKQSISDIRPQISFKTADAQSHDASVMLDGMNMGTVGEYIDGKAALMIRPGTHVLRITSGDRVLHEEKFYIGDGVNRTFIVH